MSSEFYNQRAGCTPKCSYDFGMKKASVVFTFSGVALLVGFCLGALVSRWPAKTQRIRCASELRQIGLQFRNGHNDLSAGVEQLPNPARH
jgi:hypothetical protein